MAITKDDILEAVGQMSVMDLNDLVKAFEEKFGVSAASNPVRGACRVRVKVQDPATWRGPAFGSFVVWVILVVRARLLLLVCTRFVSLQKGKDLRILRRRQ